jgi:hypothetical protein
MSDPTDPDDDWPEPSGEAHDWTAADDDAEREWDAPSGSSVSDDAWSVDDDDRDLALLDEMSEEIEPHQRSPRVRLLALALVVAMVLASAGVAAALFLVGNDEEVVGETGPPPAPTGPVAGEEGFDELVAELQAFVEQRRGLLFLEDVEIRLADGQEFEALLFEDFDEDLEDIETAGRLLTAVGLIDAGLDFAAIFRDTLGAGVVGFYDPEDNEMVLRGTRLTPHVRVTLVHELVHALQDQHFELDRPELDDADDESGLGFSAVVEGDASRIDQEYRASLTEEERQQAAAEELGNADLQTLLSVPPVVIQLLAFPYVVGPTFVQTVLDSGGQPALDQAIVEPPTTSEQIIHPDRYLRGESRIEVTPPEADGDVFDQGVLGALALALMIGDGATTPEGLEAVDGWGGDWYVAWHQGERVCLRATVVVDRPDALPALVAGLGVWQEREGGNVDAAAEGDEVSFTSCRQTAAEDAVLSG